MIDKLKNFFNHSETKKSTKYLSIAVVLLIAIFGFSKISQPLELAIYDFNFWLRPTEPTDERIVIVEWDEESIQMLEETIISDNTLLTLLNTIKKQQPRIIGLDLYRDIPVLSPRLSDAENIQAYNSLNRLFSSTDNLIGIEKVVEPIINPSSILSKREQTAASDLPTDRDEVVRRAYLFPQVDELGNPAGIPYIGVALGYQYLEAQGWRAEKLEDNSMMITDEQDYVVVEPLKAFDGIFNNETYGLNLLVNWRKGSPSFRRVSVTEVISDQIPPDLFHDRLVLIGNVSASTADRHNLPLDRWNNSWSYGVQIPAAVASSIVSAAIDRRPLINAVPKSIELAGVVISIFCVMFVINKHHNLGNLNLYLITSIYAFGLTLILILLNMIAFVMGWWLPVATAIGAIWIVYFSFNYYIYTERSRKNVLELELFVKDLQHSLGNILHSIASSVNRIQVSTSEVESNLAKSSRNNLKFETERRNNALSLAMIRKRADNIEKQVAKMERYRKRTEEFIDFSYLSKTNDREITEIARFVAEIVARFERENEYDYKVCIQQIYDPRLGSVEIDQLAIEIVLENLLDNAFYSVAPQKNSHQDLPTVKVQTRLRNRKIEFSVEDNGVGIPSKLHAKIFQPFVSYNYGQGIGLYLTRKILSLHRGNIKVESHEGHGSKFIFTLPLKPRSG